MSPKTTPNAPTTTAVRAVGRAPGPWVSAMVSIADECPAARRRPSRGATGDRRRGMLRKAMIGTARLGADELACKPDPVPGRLAAHRSATIHLGLPSPAGSCDLPAGSGGP